MSFVYVITYCDLRNACSMETKIYETYEGARDSLRKMSGVGLVSIPDHELESMGVKVINKGMVNGYSFALSRKQIETLNT